MQEFFDGLNKIGCKDIDFKFKQGEAPFPMQRAEWKILAHSFLSLPMRYVAETKASIRDAAAAIHLTLKEGAQINDDMAQILSRENAPDVFFMGNWLRYKQIYKFNKECADMLKDMDVEKVITESFKNLPYDAFYIESNFSLGCVGCFVAITADENNDPDNKYLGMEFVTNSSEAEFLTAFIQLKGEEIIVSDGFKEGKENNLKLCKEALPLILYLCSINKDIEYVEPKTKKEIERFRKSKGTKTAKVGYKIGATISSIKKVYSCPVNHNGKHTPKSPHVRKAHYQHYWSGPRDSKERKCVLKFVEPMFIKGNKAELATVHKVVK